MLATTRPSEVREDGGVVPRTHLGGPRGTGLGEHPGDHAELPDDTHAVGRITAGNERAGASHLSHPAAAVGCRTVRHPAEPAALPEERSPVVHAYILIQTEVGKAAQVAATIAEIDGVTKAEDVTGPYDVIVRAEAESVDELGRLVVARVQSVDGITRTLTCPVVNI